ncbi:MAG: hypothetical protein SCARUB_02434 [Candidatus Scalindua rubra]|uniref:Uncharacterized protein n=1 Tax=Candidatus Scalindua rubra TaxID=1872076 RepID=A0A1E3X9Y4_9BACT|nr:MAG: hypothetical protein SCARUB_02434 [Candidatus Scalindua rubra]
MSSQREVGSSGKKIHNCSISIGTLLHSLSFARATAPLMPAKAGRGFQVSVLESSRKGGYTLARSHALRGNEGSRVGNAHHHLNV